jgi:hypothetical protein
MNCAYRGLALAKRSNHKNYELPFPNLRPGKRTIHLFREMSVVAIVNGGSGSWAFQEHAERLARALWVDVSDRPLDFNFYLHIDSIDPAQIRHSFVPLAAMEVAADKREIARVFRERNVASPETHLLATRDEVRSFLARRGESQWCLKWPTGCGATGHKVLQSAEEIDDFWPVPYVVQRFVPLESPEVYRTYCVDGEIFGWTLRRFSDRSESTPWVSHAKGARYHPAGTLPQRAKEIAREALAATGLLDSFGCVDFLRAGVDWLALEVGTDGSFNHVDRDFDDPALEDEINRRLAEAFWKPIGTSPWAPGAWRYQD